MNLIVDIGGLLKFLMIIFGLIGRNINDNVMIYKQIRNLYFVKNISQEKLTQNTTRESDNYY